MINLFVQQKNNKNRKSSDKIEFKNRISEDELKEIQSWKLSDFEIKKTIGEGLIGKVSVVYSNNNKNYYVLKECKKKVIIEQLQVEHVQNERNLLLECSHYCYYFPILYRTYQDTNSIYFLMEYVQGGELFTWYY
jgi:protein kinase A